MKKVTILIVDDHSLVREACKMLLNSNAQFSVVGETGKGQEAVRLATDFQPDIVVMDINLGDISGIEATELIRVSSPLTKILAFSADRQPVNVKEAIKAGAMGYITKCSAASELVEAILKIVSGGKYICEEVRDGLMEDFLKEKKDKNLTEKERKIAEYIKRGKTSKDISQLLGIRTGTVDGYRSRILKKLEQKNSRALVNFLTTD